MYLLVNVRPLWYHLQQSIHGGGCTQVLDVRCPILEFLEDMCELEIGLLWNVLTGDKFVLLLQQSRQV